MNPTKQKVAPNPGLTGEAKFSSTYCDASKIAGTYLYGTKCTVFNDHKRLQNTFLIRSSLNMRQRAGRNGRTTKGSGLVMTIGLVLPKQILKAQAEAESQRNQKEDVGRYIG
ncbi:hypothetical protein Tco_0674350 [Tanacetum coccineum]